MFATMLVVNDDEAAKNEIAADGWTVSRRRFMQGSAAIVGVAALSGRRTPLLRRRAAVVDPAGFTLAQSSGQSHGTGSVTLTLPTAPSAAGSLLVVTVLSPAASTAFTPPAGVGGTGWQLGKAVQCAYCLLCGGPNQL